MDERATVECMDRNIENPYNASYKPLQRLTLSEIGRKTQLAVTLAGLRDPVSHETALAIWGVELPERCWRPRLGESAMDWRSPPRYREFDPDPEYVEYMRRAQLADHPDFGRSYEDAADSGSPAGTSRRRARKDAQESTRRGTQGAARRNARDVRGKAHPTENVAWESNSAACSPTAAFPNVSLHTVVRAPCLRRKARGVAEHVWKGLRDEHIHEIAGIPVLMPIPAWSLMGGSLEIWELAEVAESLIRHDYATRESLLRFVDLENIPWQVSRCFGTGAAGKRLPEGDGIASRACSLWIADHAPQLRHPGCPLCEWHGGDARFGRPCPSVRVGLSRRSSPHR